MRKNSTKLYLAIGAALALGASGMSLAQQTTTEDAQTQQSRTQQDPSTTTGTSPGTSTTGTLGTTGTERSTTPGTTDTTGTMGTERTPATGTMGTDRSTTGTTGTMGTDRSTTGTTGTMGTERSTTGTTGTTGTVGTTGITERGDGREYDQSRPGAQARGAGDVSWLIMPSNLQAQSDNMTKGCWVRLYAGENFEGRYVTIVGPSEVRELRSPYGTGLTKWDSAIVGPNATVTTYDGANFDDRNATLRPGQRYPELDDSKLGLFQDIESVRITCSGSGQTGQTGTTDDRGGY
jgi:hypothetical protein